MNIKLHKKELKKFIPGIILILILVGAFFVGFYSGRQKNSASTNIFKAIAYSEEAKQFILNGDNPKET